jgi:MFS family permease
MLAQVYFADETMVNVALPTLSRDFAVRMGSFSGVLTAHLVTLAVAMPASGWIVGRARHWLPGLVLGSRLTDSPPRRSRSRSVTLTRWLLLTALPSPCP